MGTGERRAEVDATVAAYDADASAYAVGLGAPSEETPAVVADFARRLGRGSSVLEVGSGPGHDADALEASGLRVRRTDISAGFVALLHAAGHEADLLDPLTGDLGGPWDGVWASASLLHVGRDDLPTVLRRLGEATRPAGLLHLDVKEGDGQGWSTHGHVRSARHFTYWREPPLRAVLDDAGWQVLDLRRWVGTSGGGWLSVLAARPGQAPGSHSSSLADSSGRPK